VNSYKKFKKTYNSDDSEIEMSSVKKEKTVKKKNVQENLSQNRYSYFWNKRSGMPNELVTSKEEIDWLYIDTLLNEKLSKEQIIFKQCLNELLLDSFWKCRLISQGDIIVKNEDYKFFDLIKLGATTGGLLPVIGSTCTSLSLVTSAICTGIEGYNQHLLKSRAKKINDFLPNPHKIYKACQETSTYISVIYKEQIELLNISDNGNKAFAKFITLHLLHYVGTNEGKDSAFFKKIKNIAEDYLHQQWRNFIRGISPSLYPNKDPEYIEPTLKLLNAIIFYQPPYTNNHYTKVEPKHDMNGDFYIESILQTSIKTLDMKFYTHPDCENGIEKYGYRYLPEEYALKLGYEPEKDKSEYSEENDSYSGCSIL
jgi:hypothetical protein